MSQASQYKSKSEGVQTSDAAWRQSLIKQFSLRTLLINIDKDDAKR